MSQAGPLVLNVPIGAGINQINDQLGNAVNPLGGIVNIVGAGNITTATDGASTLTISTTGLATNFHTDAGDAAPIGGVLNIIGDGNTQTTGGGQTVIIGLGNDVTIPHDLDVINDLTVGNELTVGNGANITGFVRVVGMLNPDRCVVAADLFTGSQITATTFIRCAGNLISTNGNCNTLAGFFTVGGNFESTGNGALLLNTGFIRVSALNTDGGVVQTDGTGRLSTSVGTNGQLLISGGLFGPAWANITSPDATVVITNGPSSIGLSSGATIATTYHTTAGDAAPAGKIINVVGGSNINTSAAGNTVTFNLNNSIAISGTINSTGTITTTAGNLIATNGNMQSLNGFTTTAGHYTTTGGNITTTNGTITGAHLVATTDLTLPNATGIPRVLLQNNANPGLIVPTNGTNGQVLMADAVTGVAFGNLAAGAGIGLAYNSGTRTTTITNTGAGGVKAAFFSRLTLNQTGFNTGGFPHSINGTWLTKTYDPTNSFNCTINPATFTAVSTGLYRFSLQFLCHIGTAFTGALCFFTRIVVTPPPRIYEVQGLYVSPGNYLRHQGTVQQSNDIYLTAGQTVYFTIACEENSTVSHQFALLAAQTYITGFQIS